MTAACYALCADRLIADFRQRFLHRVIDADFTRRLLHPAHWPLLWSPLDRMVRVADGRRLDADLHLAALPHDVETDPRDVGVAAAIIRMAGAFGTEVVAEGVETDGQLWLLEGLSCDQVQGHLFAQPMAAAQRRDMLLAARRCESLLEAVSAS